MVHHRMARLGVALCRWQVGVALVATGLWLVAPPASANPLPSMAGGGLQFGPHTASQFSISAHGSGPDATGSLNAHAPSGRFHAKVTCLQVTGNDAIATVIITSSHDPSNPVGEVLVGEGVDNGSPKGGTSPDLWRLSFQDNGGIVPTSQPACWLPIFTPVPVMQGNIVVSGRT